jgi:hypothetical protein
MNHTALRIQRLTRELSNELSVEYGSEQAARTFEQAAIDIRMSKVGMAGAKVMSGNSLSEIGRHPR